MNRNEEYLNLSAELEITPPSLEFAVTRAKARAKKAKRVRRFFTIPASSVIVFFAAFVVMVNLSMPFAMACGRIPLIRELAAAVAFSPSLSAAVENEYVQPIELEQSENDITMRVEYVIVDQKQLNIFYTLQSPIYSHMDAAPSIANADGTPLESYSLSSGSPQAENGELRLIVADFFEGDVPGSLKFACRVHDNGSFSTTAPVPVDYDMLFQPSEHMEPESISTFEFTLTFDPYYTQQAEIITLNQNFLLDEQKLRVTTVEIYPTHMRLNLEDDDGNTAWLQSLRFYFENEKGKRFDTISNGVLATGSVDSPMMRSHRLESSFFSKSQSLTLYITDVIWLDKDMERVKVDLANCTAEALPEGVAIERAVRKHGGWELTFSGVEKEENHSYQIFGTDYFDENGKEYTYNSWSSGMTGYYDEQLGEYVETPGVFRVQFALVDYCYDTVYLSPSFSRTTKLNEAVVIKVK